MREIPLGAEETTAQDINEHGEVVGYLGSASPPPEEAEFTFPPSDRRAFVWSAAGGVRFLEPLPGHTQSRAHGINDFGEVVGHSFTDFEPFEEFESTGVVWSREGKPFVIAINAERGFVINNRAQIVGESLPVGCTDFSFPDCVSERATLWQPQEAVSEPPSLCGASRKFRGR